MMPVLRCLIPAAGLIALSACDTQERTAVKASADGEILEGSASDAMLPLDTVRSQSPLAPRSSEAADPSGGETRGRSRTRSSADEDAPPPPAAAVADPEPAAAEDPVTPAEE